MHTLKHGLQNNPEVFFLQQLLNEQNGENIAPDGDFGPHTLMRVKNFQKDNDLPPDGIVNAATWDALRDGVDISKKIQITIDDAPGSHNAEMRDLLRRFGISTMFFVEGEFAAKRQHDIQQIVAQGHGLGLHTWDHPKLTTLNDAQIKDEIVKTDELIKKQTGQSMAPNWRPPYGAVNQKVRKAAEDVGFTKMWLWDVDSLDWKYLGHTNSIVMEVVKGLAQCRKDTCDILFHDKPTTVKALNVLLPLLEDEGNELVDFP